MRWASFFGALLSAQLALLALGQSSNNEILREAQQDFDWLQSCYRSLHAIPELRFDLHKTSAFVRSQLDGLGVRYEFPYAQTGIVATIGSREPVFGLTEDMDALPIQEEVDIPHRSTHPGRMHACGHDAHTTFLLGAAKLLKAREGELKGTVKLLFRPAEEGGAGAKVMMDEGALAGIEAITMIHVGNDGFRLEAGEIATRDGTQMAGFDRFNVEVFGSGGHACNPDQGTDPVMAAALIIVGLQPLVSRETSPTDSAVVTVSRINTGQRAAGEGGVGVIPDSIAFNGTITAVTRANFARMRERVTKVVKSTAEAHGCSATVSWLETPYGPTINDKGMVSMLEDVAGQVLGEGKFNRVAPGMPAEDFSFFTDVIPGLFYWLGIYNESVASVHGVHTSRFRMDENQLPVGAALHASLALEYFAKNSKTAEGREEL